MRRVLLALAVLGALVITASVLWQPARPGAARPGNTTTDGRTAVTILAADEHGAVLFDRATRTYRGVRGDGSTAWTDAPAARIGASVACLVSCPDVVVSGSVESLRAAAVTDPEPYAYVGGARRPFTTPSARKRRVLAAAAPGGVVLALGDPAGYRLQLPGGVLVSVAGPRTQWSASPDGRHALAVSTGDDGHAGRARWFRLGPAGWAPEPDEFAVPGTAACAAAGGGVALVIGGAPALLAADARTRPVTDLVNGGACAWSASGGIVAELAFDEHGARHSRLRALDRTGQTVWTRDVAAEAAITGDPTAPRVGYAAAAVFHEIDLTTGAETRTLLGVASATYTAAGTLVTITAGAARWLPHLTSRTS